MAFGHGSARGLVTSRNPIALDTGCVWGGPLTAVRLEDRSVFQEPCVEQGGEPGTEPDAP